MDGGDAVYGRRELEKEGDKRLFFLFLGLVAVVIAAWAGPTGPAQADGRAVLKPGFSPLAIETAGGSHNFQVELAATRRARERGLMGRTSLAPDRGMLFDYGAPTRIAMWMKNTLIPLDIIFVDGAGRVVSVRNSAVPLSLETITVDGPARAALELAGGTAARIGVAAGDRVRHEIFGDDPGAR